MKDTILQEENLSKETLLHIITLPYDNYLVACNDLKDPNMKEAAFFLRARTNILSNKDTVESFQKLSNKISPQDKFMQKYVLFKMLDAEIEQEVLKLKLDCELKSYRKMKGDVFS